MRLKVPIDEIKFDRDLYPRFQADNETVNQYRLAIDSLPPLLVTKDLVLVDGYHRLLAYRLEGVKEVEVEILETDDPKEILLEAVRRNSTHGRQLSIAEKRENAKKLWSLGLRDVDKLASILSVSTRTIQRWTRELREREDEELNRQILDLYLQCNSFREIAKELNMSHMAVRNRLIKHMYNLRQLSENIQPESLQLYNVWNVKGLSPSQLQYPGQTPLEIVENIIYYYTDPPRIEPELKFDKVVDPMAGSGVVAEACRKLLRRYLLLDLKPMREDIPIIQNDILEGFPPKAYNADLVYFDPPYYNLMDDYPRNMFNESYESFLKAMEISLRNIMEILSEDGKVALILKPMNEKMLGGEWLDLTIDCVEIARSLGYKLVKRICAPLPTQQFRAVDVQRAKERRIMLNTLRDIVILKGDR